MGADHRSGKPEDNREHQQPPALTSKTVPAQLLVLNVGVVTARRVKGVSLPAWNESTMM